ncbi:MAG TPA: hypothetical protein DCR55_06895 [Lentisphaeria bacterium]|nr:hypothetical protein [Lentisphaeria bacterium]
MQVPAVALVSIEIGETITKVRTAKRAQGLGIVASSYDGAILGLTQAGEQLWRAELSGLIKAFVACPRVVVQCY